MARLLIALALVAAACGGGATTSSTPASTPATAVPGDGVESTATRQRPDGRDAPDFVLALGQGGEFSPSLEDKPIYMVFWAEW